MSSRKKKSTAYRYRATGSAYNNQHSHSRKGRNNDRTFVIAGLAVIVVLVLVIIFIGVFRSSGGSVDDGVTLEAASISDEAITQNAVIDLSGILPESAAEEDKILSITGLTPAEISEEIQKRYDWSLRLVNNDALVGSEVLQTVDPDATTEEATMGDEENPDGINTTESSEESSGATMVVDAIHVPDLIALCIPDFISEIVAADNEYKESLQAATPTEAERSGFFSGGQDEETTESEAPVTYELTLNIDDFADEIDAVIDEAATMWYVEPQGGSISSYDADTDSFIMETSKAGFRVDTDAVRADIEQALNDKDFAQAIRVEGETLSAESDITVGDYAIVATYTTRTSANSVRNKNIRLACEAINGTILRPGEEFSFNDTVGERTEEKGYGAAAAYNNGEVVQEIGGGVCQVSTTLYNAVTLAGLKTTNRRSHTFEPSYVTPGLDATVSWGGPDYKFANIPAIAEYSNSETYAIGIRASYSNNTVTVSIYSRPVLKDGITYELNSVKERDLDLVSVMITPGDGRTPTNGSQGSIWNVNLVVRDGDETVSDSRDHRAIYTGHTQYYYDPSIVTPAVATPVVPSPGVVFPGVTVPGATVGDTPVISGEPQTSASDPVESESESSAPSENPPVDSSDSSVEPGPVSSGPDNSTASGNISTVPDGSTTAPGDSTTAPGG